MDNKKILDDLIKYLNTLEHTSSDDMPDLNLYMDQLTAFMENSLKKHKRDSDEKILTKTMINNYSKNRLLPPPQKKKYSKEHMLMLFFIYYYKNIISLKDIETLTEPLNELYFNNNGNLSLKEIYDEVFSFEDSEMKKLIYDLKEKFKISKNAFTDESLSDSEKEYLRLFTFVSLLGFDVYIKRQIILKIIDAMK